MPSSASSSQIFLDRADPFGQHLVIGRRHLEERDVVGGHGPDAGDDVAGGQRDVLHARPAVVLEELVDLGPPPAMGRLVDRELDPAAAVGDDLGHERRVLGADVLVVEARQQREAHDLAVVINPVAHLAFLDVGDDVVDRLQADGMERARAVAVRVERLEARREDAVDTATGSRSVCVVSP